MLEVVGKITIYTCKISTYSSEGASIASIQYLDVIVTISNDCSGLGLRQRDCNG